MRRVLFFYHTGNRFPELKRLVFRETEFSIKNMMEERKMKKKALAVLLTATMVMSLTACGSSADTKATTETATEETETGSGADAVTINFSFDQGVGEPTQQIVDEFNASQSEVYVNTVILPQDADAVHDDFVNKLASEDTSVDVMALDVTYVSEFAAADWLLDLGEYFDGTTTDQYLEGTIVGATYDNKLVAFPWFTNASALFYRTDVLEELGVTEIPTTYEGWEALAEQAQGVNGVEYLASFQGAQGESMVCNWVEYLWNFGGDVLSTDGTPTVNSEENIAATQKMVDWASNYAPEGVTTYTETESEQVFLAGKSLLIRDWSGFWSSANAEGSEVAGKVGVTMLPVETEGGNAHSCLGGLDLVVNKYIDDAHKEAAIKFITYMTSYDTEKEMTLIAAQPPVLKAVYEDVEILEKIPFYADFYDVIQGGKSRPLSPSYSKLSDAIQRNIHEALTGEATVEEALNALQEEAEGLQ